MALPSGYRFPDVSRYRTVCNWDAFDDYPAAACKATEGAAGHDPSFQSWRRSMRARGKFPIAYHFLRRESSVAGQVSNYLEAADDGKPFGVMLDVESGSAGTSPTIPQANEWLDRVSGATGIPRRCMLTYMPRWWYQAHGGGNIALKDTICHNSHFSNSPFLGSYAGWGGVDVIQYSSTAPIAGVCAPGTGDMNVAIGMTAQQFIASLTGGTVVVPPKPEVDMPYITTYGAPDKPPRCFVDGVVVGFPNPTEMAEFVKPYKDAGYEVKAVNFPEVDDWQRYMDGQFSRIEEVKSILNNDNRWTLLSAAGADGAAGGNLDDKLDGILQAVQSARAVAFTDEQLATIAAQVGRLNEDDLTKIRQIVDSELDGRSFRTD